MFYKLFHRRDLDKTFFQVLVAMIMVFVLLICAASPVNAVVGTTSILIPAVIAALESWGISVAADGLDGAEIAEWFHDKLTDWSTYASISLSNIVTGIKMTPFGQVFLNPFALNAVRLFADWFAQQNGLTAGGSSVQVISGGTMFNGFLVYPVTDLYFIGNSRWTYSVDQGSDVFGFFTYKGGVVFANFVSLQPFKIDAYANGTLREIYTGTLFPGTSVYYWDGAAGSTSATYSVPVSTFSMSDVANGSGGVQNSDGTMSIVPSSSMSVPSTADIQDKEMLINTSLDVGADAAAWYEQVMNKVAANDFTATAAITQAGTITADQVIPQEGITDVDGTVSWPDVTAPIGVSGLDEIFPFCIPFDVYHFFQALAADPVAPSFEIPFVIPNIVDYTFELDLSDFDQVAQILRTVELLAFCVGLAFVTRSFFIRG